MVLSRVASLAEPPVVPSSGYYSTNNFNPNMMEFTQNNQIYLGEWDVVGVENSHHQIPTTVSSPSSSTINQNQTTSASVIGNSTSPNHPNSPPGSNGNPTSIHQDQSSNYLSYPMNDDQNTSNLLINGSHDMINSNAVQGLGALGQNVVDGTNINVNGNNIDNDHSTHQIMVQPHPHHPMLIQSTSHSQPFSNSSTSTSNHVWVQQQQW
ncbi:13561_t:CDS:1 [Funneliformis geosporum]|uniref:13561_t:CDS:1 n=1 Tax=Funneliformis geosporum TaxID=1117311 RepID=A0A9W4WJL7_9GLOM|nr:13561_t:CDS:1 [Funneliformis geosporum]